MSYIAARKAAAGGKEILKAIGERIEYEVLYTGICHKQY